MIMGDISMEIEIILIVNGGQSRSQLNFTPDGNNYSPSGVEFGEAEGWRTDSDLGAYLANRSAANEYRAAGRAGDCDVFKTLAKTNLAGKLNGKNERAMQLFGGISAEYKEKFKSSRGKRSRANDRRNSTATRQARIAETAGVRMLGDYEKRTTGLPPCGGLACFECGDTARFWKGFAVYLAKQGKFQLDPQGSKKSTRKWGEVRNGSKVGKLKMALPDMRRFLRNKRSRFQMKTK